MYNLAYLRETVRRMVHRVYLRRKCTIYLPISVPRYLRDRGHETDTLVPRISRSIGLASSAARPTPSSLDPKGFRITGLVSERFLHLSIQRRFAHFLQSRKFCGETDPRHNIVLMDRHYEHDGQTRGGGVAIDGQTPAESLAMLDGQTDTVRSIASRQNSAPVITATCRM